MYPLGTILMCLGLIFVIIKMIKDRILKVKKSEEIDLSVIMLFIFISNFILSFLTTLNINKANGIYISATYFIFIALIALKQKVKIIYTIILFSLTMLFILFIKEYFTIFANEYHIYFDNESINALRYVYSTDLKDRKLCTDINYINSLYANPISPYEFYENIKTIDVSGGIEVIGYDKYIEGIDLSNIEDDTVYITWKPNIAKALLEKGFKEDQYMYYYILYK